MKVTITYEFENEDEAREHLGGSTRAEPVPMADQPTESLPEETSERDDTGAAEMPDGDGVRVDVDGQPWDADIHSESFATNADGTWRAKRGHADAAKQAKAEFKARGGAEPVEAEPAGMPTGGTVMPTAEKTEDLPPVSFEQCVTKLTGMMDRNTITAEKIAELHQKHVGGEIPVYNTNESARANLYYDLCEIEPDLS